LVSPMYLLTILTTSIRYTAQVTRQLAPQRYRLQLEHPLTRTPAWRPTPADWYSSCSHSR
jgi:hypothetical protein